MPLVKGGGVGLGFEHGSCKVVRDFFNMQASTQYLIYQIYNAKLISGLSTI